QRHDPQDPVGVEPEVVADLGQQHAEGGPVQLVRHVEPEQHPEREERRPTGGPLLPARPPARLGSLTVGGGAVPGGGGLGTVPGGSVEREPVVGAHDGPSPRSPTDAMGSGGARSACSGSSATSAPLAPPPLP